MILISLDLSTTRTGVAFFNEKGELLKRLSITPDEKLHPYLKIKYIVDAIKSSFPGADDCIVEGIYLNTYASGKHGVTGFETLARLSGAVINEWLNHHDKLPTLFKATEARKLVGVNGSCQKAEVQIWVARKFGFATEDQLKDFEAMIEAQNAQLAEDLFTKATWKKHMGNISTYIEGEIELGEDEADACLLGCAWIEAKKAGKI